MLNELLIVERGARRAGIATVELHPDVKDAGKIPTLLVLLDAQGEVEEVQPLPAQVRAWTLRDAKHNSFPFVKLQGKPPLWPVRGEARSREEVLRKGSTELRIAILSMADGAHLDAESFGDWPGEGLLRRLAERRRQLSRLERSDAAVVPATIDRFLLACDRARGGDPHRLLQALTARLVEGLRQSAQTNWVDVAVALLLGKPGKKTIEWRSSGALLFDVSDVGRRIYDGGVRIQVSEVLRSGGGDGAEDQQTGICALTGERGRLRAGDFPEPKLRVLGETRIYSKNRDIPANDRYGRYGSEAMLVGQDTAIRLAAALRALTEDEREGITWQRIPGEGRKQGDLLLAFVEEAPDAPVAAALGDDGTEEDFAEEAVDLGGPQSADSIAAFEKRTERIILAVQAKVGADFRRTPVRLTLFRKVDQANRKVVLTGTPTVVDLYDAATGWAAGERNVPPWFRLQVHRKGLSEPFLAAPSHIAPLGVIAFTKQVFIRGGTERQEAIGLTAAEALALFLDPVRLDRVQAHQRVARSLRIVLNRRSDLLCGTAHALHRELEFAMDFDRREALRTVTMLGVLLHKLDRSKEVYMSDPAFKLGQLLAAADVVHAGYCADVRKGDVPPSLLGNQVFTIAQTDPVKALATLSRRWKPYTGWVTKAARERHRADELAASTSRRDQQRGWDIRKALRHAREIPHLAAELAPMLPECTVNDVFRAELLLGYIAGLPKPEKEAGPHESATMAEGVEE